MSGRKESFIRNKINPKGSAEGSSGPVQEWPGRRQAGGEHVHMRGASGRTSVEGLGAAGVWAGVIYRSAGAIGEGNISPCQR